MKVLVCGTRADGSPADLFDVLDELNPRLIISGGAKGADSMAIDYAEAHGIPYVVYKPLWDSYGIRAGFVRNVQMLEEGKPDIVVARWDRKSNGTAHTIEQAQARGIPVKIVPIVS